METFIHDGHYMETKSPYHDTIVMKNRIKYVSGGQAQRSLLLPTDGKMDTRCPLTAQGEVCLSNVMVKIMIQLIITEGSKYSRTLVR